MSKSNRPLAFTVAALAIGAAAALWSTAGALGQAAGMPSTKNGDWTHYTADVRGAKYAPLDQVNASNFNTLEGAWRVQNDKPGTPAPVQLPRGTPAVPR